MCLCTGVFVCLLICLLVCVLACVCCLDVCLSVCVCVFVCMGINVFVYVIDSISSRPSICRGSKVTSNCFATEYIIV